MAKPARQPRDKNGRFVSYIEREPSNDPRPRDRFGHFLPHRREREPEMDTEAAISKLQDEGYTIIKEDKETDKRFRIDLKRFSGKPFKIGAISCSHLCSRYQQLTHLHTFYKLAKKEGVSTILHTGDLCDGNGQVYRGHQYEIFEHGADAQRDYIVDNYPKVKGITTHFINGNHDESWWKSAGYNIGEKIAERRNDMKYLGFYGAFVTVGGIKIYLHHGAGGVAYARSYKLQKLIEQLAPEQKPNIVLQGHYHVSCVLEMYRNVEGFSLGCFQAQTPYLKRLGVYPSISGRIITITPDKTYPGGTASIESKFIPFYKVIENDH